MNNQKIQFGSKLGLIAATVGSAVGLGNIWRFPSVTQNNGGAAFLLIYIFCVLLLGIPVMLGEFTIGREGGSDVITDYKKLSPRKHWWMIGSLGVATSYIILCFYLVVAGWTLEYLINSVSGTLFKPVPGVADVAGQYGAKMQEYVHRDRGPIFYTALMIAVNFAVLLGGVRKGIERISSILMPLLFVLILIFMGVVLTRPGAGEGVRFFLNPDFSKVTARTVIDALGQAFFSLSLGMGTLATYASYFPAKNKLMNTAVSVSFLDMLIALMMGLVIFPAVSAFGLSGHGLEGETLVFVTMPTVFENMAGTRIWSTLFFLLLFTAALTSTISLFEVSVRYFQDRLKLNRTKAVLTVALPVAVISTLCCLSLGSMPQIGLFGMGLFSLLDWVTTNIFLPSGGLLMCVYLGWFAPEGIVQKQLTNGGTFRCRLASTVFFIIKWMAPVLIAVVMIFQFVG